MEKWINILFGQKTLNRLGRCLAAWWLDRFSSPTILLGTDTRETSQRMKIALVEGLTRGGVQVLDGDILPTAAVSNLVTRLPDVSGGIVITASHNPIFEDGIKIFDRNGCKLKDGEEAELKALFFDDNSHLPNMTRPAQLRAMPDASQRYATALAHEFWEIEGYPIGYWLIAPMALLITWRSCSFRKLDFRIAYLNVSPDGMNINRNAGSEYVRRQPGQFFDEMLRHKASLGDFFRRGRRPGCHCRSGRPFLRWRYASGNPGILPARAAGSKGKYGCHYANEQYRLGTAPAHEWYPDRPGAAMATNTSLTGYWNRAGYWAVSKSGI